MPTLTSLTQAGGVLGDLSPDSRLKIHKIFKDGVYDWVDADATIQDQIQFPATSQQVINAQNVFYSDQVVTAPPTPEENSYYQTLIFNTSSTSTDIEKNEAETTLFHFISYKKTDDSFAWKQHRITEDEPIAPIILTDSAPDTTYGTIIDAETTAKTLTDGTVTYNAITHSGNSGRIVSIWDAPNAAYDYTILVEKETWPSGLNLDIVLVESPINRRSVSISVDGQITEIDAAPDVGDTLEIRNLKIEILTTVVKISFTTVDPDNVVRLIRVGNVSGDGTPATFYYAIARSLASVKVKLKVDHIVGEWTGVHDLTSRDAIYEFGFNLSRCTKLELVCGDVGSNGYRWSGAIDVQALNDNPKRWLISRHNTGYIKLFLQGPNDASKIASLALGQLGIADAGGLAQNIYKLTGYQTKEVYVDLNSSTAAASAEPELAGKLLNVTQDYAAGDLFTFTIPSTGGPWLDSKNVTVPAGRQIFSYEIARTAVARTFAGNNPINAAEVRLMTWHGSTSGTIQVVATDAIAEFVEETATEVTVGDLIFRMSLSGNRCFQVRSTNLLKQGQWLAKSHYNGNFEDRHSETLNITSSFSYIHSSYNFTRAGNIHFFYLRHIADGDIYKGECQVGTGYKDNFFFIQKVK